MHSVGQLLCFEIEIELKRELYLAVDDTDIKFPFIWEMTVILSPVVKFRTHVTGLRAFGRF